MHRFLIVPLASIALWGGAPAQAQTNPDDGIEEARALIQDLGEISTPEGIDVLERVRLGGMEQWISIRGKDRDNPVLLFVHGGPGAPEMGIAWTFQRAWEDYFTVVQWDQRGAGKTLRENGEAASTPTLTREQITADAGELIGLLREKFGQDRIVVVGHSWGNAVGLGAALQHPNWVSVYVGIGPLLRMAESERIGYDRLLRIAHERRDESAIAELEALAPYPGDGPLTFERIGAQRKWVMAFGGLAAYRDNARYYFNAPTLSPTYEAADIDAIDEGGRISVSALLPEMTVVDFASVRSTAFPVVMFVGRHDLTTPYEVTAQWLDSLDAPSKRLVMFEHSAHLPMVEEPGRALVALVEEVLPLAQEGR